MMSTSLQDHRSLTRTYDRLSSVVFLKTRESFGGLSNMAGGFPLLVNGIHIRTSEALYQACRFPHLPEVQWLIIDQESPMAAKMKSKPYRHDSRPDWNRVRVSVMRWCLRVKLAQNWDDFSKLLLDTGYSPIVEHSRRDDFWGAKPLDERTLLGMNVLGRLLMELRELVKTETQENLLQVEPLPMENFLLGGCPIEPITGRTLEQRKPVGGLPALEPIGTQLPLARVGARQLRHRSTEYAVEQTRGNLKPYPIYKDSGVQWLGDVPKHWVVLPNRALFQEVKERDHPEEPMLSVTITKGIIQQRELLSDSSKKDSSNQDKSAYKLVRPGDIAYNKMRAWQGAVGVSDYQGIVSPAYVVERPREGSSSRYLHYLLRTPAFAKEAERWSYGITSDMWSLRPEHFKMIYGCLPPLAEQTAIVRYLDHVDRRIQRYILAKQKLIALLEEQKQAVIHQAVTGRVDVRTGRPYPAYKPSGVDWLGKVPEHWEVVPLKHLVPQVTVGIVIQPAKLYVSSGVPCLRSLNISSGTIRSEDMVFISEQSNAEHKKSRIFEGDVVVVRTGQAGVAAIVTPEFDGANCIDLLVVRRSLRLLSEYLLTYLNSWPARNDVQYRSVGAIQAHYNTNTLANLVVPVPPLAEQKSTLHNLAARLDSIVRSTQAALRQINLLQEYRTRLIADVVTGKLDVREAAERLPDEIEEPRPHGEDEPLSEPVDDAIERTEALH